MKPLSLSLFYFLTMPLAQNN